MSRESSLQGATGESTYIDLGATTPEAYRISSTSRRLAREIIGDAGIEDRIRQRCSVAVGDFAMAGLMRFVNSPAEAGLNALAKGAPIFTDIRMVQTGIQKKGHNSEITCALDFGASIAERYGITRTSAGFQELGDRLNGSIVAIGNAPSALLKIIDMISHGVRPALIIGTPVGFVNAKESKEALREVDIPSISNEGTRGGTPIAVAALNELITIYSEGADA